MTWLAWLRGHWRIGWELICRGPVRGRQVGKL